MDIQPMLVTSFSVAILALFYKQAQNKSALQYTIGVVIACMVLSLIMSATSGYALGTKDKKPYGPY
jgi:riboflavin transporter FmnP